MYQDLNHSTQMRAFGLDLANSAARALQDTFVKALPYLILVAIVVVTYFVQQRQITARNKNNPTINDSPAAAQQQMIMKIFPIFSGVFAFIVPAALAWYFLVQNVFRIGQQAYITKRFYQAAPRRHRRQAGVDRRRRRTPRTPRPRPSRRRRAAVATRSGRPRRRHRPRRSSRRAAQADADTIEQRQAPGGPEAPAAADRDDAEAPGPAAPPAEEEALTRRSEEAIPMEWVETTGRTTEEAKDHTLDQLGVDESDAEFEILEEPRPGLFGRIRGEARVRARVRPTAPRPKVERRDRRDRRSKDKPRSADTATPRSNGEDRPAGAEGADGAASEAAPGREPAPARSRSMNPPPEETTMSNGEHSPEEVAEDATVFVVGLLDAFGLDGTVAASQPADGEIEIAVEGEGLGLLVGPKGQTLLAIQDLTRLVAQRHVGPGSPRLGVDVGGYRQRRVEALRRFSLQVAEQVVETGLPKSLEPMAAADRKVVHDALTDVVGVSTLSEGEEPYRRVVIVPEGVGG